MQYSFLAIASLLATAYAQGVPSCAAGCVKLPAGCGTADVSCICGNSEFISNVSCCVSKNCDAADQSAALQYAQNICAAGGVTLSVTAATCTGSSTSAASTSTSAAPAGGSSSSGTSTAASTSATATGSSSMSMSMGASSSSASGGSAIGGSTMSTSTRTGGAAQVTVMAGYLGAAVAGFALL